MSLSDDSLCDHHTASKPTLIFYCSSFSCPPSLVDPCFGQVLSSQAHPPMSILLESLAGSAFITLHLSQDASFLEVSIMSPSHWVSCIIGIHLFLLLIEYPRSGTY